MEKYHATILYHASEPLAVEAESPEAAADEAYANMAASLCHYCSNRLQLEDSYGVVICDEAGDEVYTDQPLTIMPEAYTTAQRRIERMEWALRAIAREASAPNATGAADRFQAIARAALQEAE